MPDYTIANVYFAEDYPEDLQRVIVLPVAADGVLEASVRRELDAIFRAEIGQQRRFELILPTRAEIAAEFGEETYSSQEPVPFTFFEHWREKWSADGVIFVDIDHYRPYKPLRVGVRVRLVELEKERTVWAVDEVFDAGNPQVAVSAQRFQRAYNDAPFPADTAGSVLISPARFSKYVAWQIFQALPRPVPAEGEETEAGGPVVAENASEG